MLLRCSILLCFALLSATADDSPHLVRVAVLRNEQNLNQVFRALRGHDYSGTVRVISSKQGYTAVNILDVEDYLLGVIGKEMNPKAPLEALKAQAIAARSHALYQTSISSDQPYDLVANLSQAYAGKTRLSKNIIIAIEATRGQVLFYRGKPIPAFFHDSCGGHTETVQSVWTQIATKLQLPGTTPCPYCATSKDRKWSFDLNPTVLQRCLEPAGYRVGSSPSITIPSRAEGGHALTVAIRSELGEILLSAEKFRSLLGYSNLRSTLFHVSQKETPDGKPSFSFQGDGYGHGVGLCQYGARVMALRGARCETILARYFPKASIGSYPDNRLASTR